MPIAVSDALSNADSQIARAAKVVGRSPQARAVFTTIYTGKLRVKSVRFIARTTKLTPKQVLTHGKKFVDTHLVERVRVKEGTAYRKIDFFHRHKAQILSLAGRREKRAADRANGYPSYSLRNPPVDRSTPRPVRRRADQHRQPPSVVTVLFISANPVQVVAYHPADNAPLAKIPLSLEQELREIKRKVRASDHRERLRLVQCPAARPTDLLQAFNEERPQIVHFSGHGTDTNELVLLDDQGQPRMVPKATIESLFRVMKGEIKVVLLNACFSRAQAAAITKHIDCAIGMVQEIGDSAAITFSAAFYSAVAFGKSVQQAFDEARLELQLACIAEDKTPRLLARKGVDPSRIRLVAA